MIIMDKGAVLSDDLEIAECMNTYFVNISKTMDIKKWPEQCPCIDTDDIIAKAIHKYENHPSIITIKYNIGEIVNKFEFEHILPGYVYEKIKQLDASKSSSGKIPTKIIKDSVDICCNLITDRFNTSIYDCSFPKSMKLGDITPVFKDDEKVYKENYRPVCTLSPFSKVFERILGEQIHPYIYNKLPDLCGFRKGYSTQHALLNLIENWRKHLEIKETIGVIVCDLSKAFDTLPPRPSNSKIRSVWYWSTLTKTYL